jgi:FPC/CPF motif-containing protein YcgG
VRHNAYAFGLYPGMATRAASAALACDLRRFIADDDLAREPLTAFAASFVAPVPVDEEHFEELLWGTLQLLSDADAAPWAADRGADPADPRFAFSMGERAFFIVGLHAGSSRMARRFAWPTIVFNPHEQFDRLRLDGKYARFQRVIRAAEVALQGNSNPMLSDFGEQSEARQYSGRFVDASWKCPFHPPHHAGPSGGEE